MKKLLFTTLMLTLFAVVCQAQNSNYSFKEDYRVSSAPKVSLYTVDGDIKVYASNDNQVKVFYRARRRNQVLKVSKAELEKDFEFIVNHSQNNLEIKVKDKRQYHRRGNSINIDLEVYAPTQAACKLRSVDGDVMVKGLNNDQELRTTDGNLKITQVKGNIDARTTDGNILFENVTGALNLVSTDGNIRGNVNKVTDDIRIKTVDGNIKVNVPSNTGVDVDSRGESVNVQSVNFSGKSTKKGMIGKINGGGKLIKIRTVDGLIKLDM